MNDADKVPETADTPNPNDPREGGLPDAERHDPHSGQSDDPRVDPTPDRRHSEK